MFRPKVSVIFPVYNCERYLHESLQSILNQTFRDFELIIINDGSTDASAEILKSYSDPRIRLINQENIGLIGTLNKGINIARGSYIARMDADDVSLPDRFMEQVKVLDQQAAVAMVGTWVERIDSVGNTVSKKRGPTDTWRIRWRLLFRNCIVHPSVMYRKNEVQELNGYDESFRVAEDYELWTRLCKVGQIIQLPRFLVKYRINDQGESARAPDEQLFNWRRIHTREISQLLGRPLSESESDSLCKYVTNQRFDSAAEVRTVVNLLKCIFRAFRQRYVIPKSNEAMVRNHVGNRLLELSRVARKFDNRLALRIVLDAIACDPRIMRRWTLPKRLGKGILRRRAAVSSLR